MPGTRFVGQTTVGSMDNPDAYAFFGAHIWRDTDTGRYGPCGGEFIRQGQHRCPLRIRQADLRPAWRMNSPPQKGAPHRRVFQPTYGHPARVFTRPISSTRKSMKARVFCGVCRAEG